MRAGRRARLYTSIREVLHTLDALAARGTLLGAVTSLPGALATAGLQRTGLAARFGAVIHAGHGKPYKPRPDPLLKALVQLGLEPSRAIFYVGDFLSDGDASLAAGLSFA